MSFVVVLIGGIALSISTCLKVWERSGETAELNEEARAAIEMVSRDIRGTYLGLQRKGGYFLAGANADDPAAGPALEFTTESSSFTRAALQPELPTTPSGEQQTGPPATDYVAVRYELVGEGRAERPGLYRTTWVAPSAEWLDQQPLTGDAVGVECISDSVVNLALTYWDGQAWVGGWVTTKDNTSLPRAVAVQLTVRDARGGDHVYESTIFVPTS